MKKLLILGLISLSLFSCDDSKTGQDLMPENSDANQLDTLSDIEGESSKGSLICLWEKAGLYSEPIKPNKWLKGLSFGRNLEYLADTIIDGKTYFKIRLIEGDEGWVNSYLVVENATVKIVTEKTSIYKAPDPLQLSEKSIDLGDLIVVENEVIGDFYKFYTQEKKLVGYIKTSAAISSEANVLEAGQVLNLIKTKKDTVEMTEALIDFQTNSDYNTTPFVAAASELLMSLQREALQKEKESEKDEKAIEKKLMQVEDDFDAGF